MQSTLFWPVRPNVRENHIVNARLPLFSILNVMLDAIVKFHKYCHEILKTVAPIVVGCISIEKDHTNSELEMVEKLDCTNHVIPQSYIFYSLPYKLHFASFFSLLHLGCCIHSIHQFPLNHS